MRSYPDRHVRSYPDSHIAIKVLDSFRQRSIPEVAHLGRTYAGRTKIPTYFDTRDVSNGGTEAVNSITDKVRRSAHGSKTLITTDSGSWSPPTDADPTKPARPCVTPKGLRPAIADGLPNYRASAGLAGASSGMLRIAGW